MIAVMDGVGSWSANKLIDVGAYTKELSRKMEQVYNSMRDSGDETINLKDIMESAVRLCKNPGSTTVVMAELCNSSKDKEVTLKTCNLGDSGYMLLRP